MMISSNAFNYINVLDKAADASMKRQGVLNNNIANVGTPGYKRKDVQFETYLMSALNGSGSLDKQVAGICLNNLNASVYTDNSDLSYRLDGNNVSADTENSYLAQNQIRYYALLDSMTHEFSRLKSVLQ
jgi:flagellar basal-body rod protein FlgB